ncbi:hypothetical protein QUC31_015295 [Theobroma cacao]
MPLLNLQIHRSLSSASSPADALLAGKALTFLKRHPYHLNSLTSNFTPEAAFCLLLKSQNDQTLILKFLKWARPHPFFTPQCKCLTLHILTKFKLYKSAQSLAEDLAVNTSDDEKGSFVFQCLKETYHSCASSSSVFDLVVKSYARLKLIVKALNIVNLAKFNGFMPGVLSYNAILDAVIRCKKPVRFAEEVFAEMIRHGVTPNVFTYNILIREMVRNGLTPNVITYTSLINSMCKAGNMNRAMEFFDQMHVRGLRPNERTYTTLIDGFSQQGRLNEAYRLLDEMGRNGFSPSLVTYNTLINGHCMVGSVEESLKLIQDMVGKGLAPDLVSYSTIISGFCKSQDLERAFRMKQEMVEKGFLPDAITYSSLIQGLCQQSRLTEACDLFQEMLNAGVTPDEFTYTTLINSYCKEGDIEKAFLLHDEMVQKGLLPDVVTYSVLINGLNKQTRTREAKKLLLKFFYDESVPSDVMYNTLIENCRNIEFKSVLALMKGFCMNGLMKEAERVFESMLQRNFKPDEAVYNVIIHGHCRGGNIQKAYDLYKEMVNSGFVPHTLTVIALVKALFMDGKTDKISQVIANTIRSCKLIDAELAKVLVEINHKEGNMDAAFNVLTEMAKDGLLPNSG